MRKSWLHLLLAMALLLISVTPAFAQEEPDDLTPTEVFGENAVFLPMMASVSDVQIALGESEMEVAALASPARFNRNLLIEGPATEAGPRAVLNPDLSGVTGRQQIIVRMNNASVAQSVALSGLDSVRQSDTRRKSIAEQDALVSWVQSRDASARVIDRLQIALNAVILEVDASILAEMAGRPGVASINPVVDYELDLSETVPYIGATAAQAAGVTGAGVVVAVLDSGVDYTHANLGGAGTVAAYEAAYGLDTADPLNTTRDGLFPTAKVIDGYDFVGEDWPNSDLAPDDDPIDFEGHGTHVSDIIAGNDGAAHLGVAPGASIYAVKVCSAVATSCSGVALIQGMEFALDPNDDGDMSDAADVINMSLGSSYGQKEDDLSLASTNATKAGVVVVASAGNSADRPYILGSPSSTPEVISVAQTQVPSALSYALKINAPAAIAGLYQNTAALDFAPITAEVTADVVYVGRACPGDALLADPTGKIALVDRGTCAVSLKVDVVADAGASAMLLGLVAAGDASSFSYGGGDNMVPSLVIIKAYADLIKANIAAPVNATLSPAVSTPLIGSMAASSSRGPSYSYQQVKPDIAAPGASVSAEVGTGTGTTAFGGTSGAAPMVSGSAALLLEKYPHMKPHEVKSRLMNTADTNITTNPATQPGVLAPITRIGGGEVRVDDAILAGVSAWDVDAKAGSLSFGYQALTHDKFFFKRVRVQNYTNQWRAFSVTPSFRYADDAASGAVSVEVANKVVVPPHGSRIILVKLKVDADKLPLWGLDGGALGGQGALLQSVEFDGYLTLSDNKDTIHLAWQILPRRAGGIMAFGQNFTWSGKIAKRVHLVNFSTTDGLYDTYALLASSPRIPKSSLPGPGENFAVVDLRAVGARAVSDGPDNYLEVAINTFGFRSHPAYPAEFDVYIDVDGDGVDDYVAYTLENGGFAVTGQTVVAVQKLTATAGTVVTFLDADLDSANARLFIPYAYIGNPTLNTQLRISVYAFDNYFTGALTDSAENLLFTPGLPRFGPLDSGSIAPGGYSAVTPVTYASGSTASPSQFGLLYMYRNQGPGFEADLVKIK